MYDVVAFGMMTASGLHSIQMNTRDSTYLLNAAYLEKPWLDRVVQNLQSA
jgi:N-formylglutamate amidohydrolase